MNTMDLNKLQGKPKTYTIGKSLPPEEQDTIEVYPLASDDLHLVQIDPKFTPKEQLDRLFVVLVKMLRQPEEELRKIDAIYLEDIMAAVYDRLGIKDEKLAKMKALLEEQRAK